jgi:hypothetical protein
MTALLTLSSRAAEGGQTVPIPLTGAASLMAVEDFGDAWETQGLRPRFGAFSPGRADVQGRPFVLADAGDGRLGAWLSKSGPEASLTLKVGRRASSLDILHTYRPGPGIDRWMRAAALSKRIGRRPPLPPVVLSGRVTYEDGQVVPIRLRYQEAVGSWYRFVGPAYRPMPWATPIEAETLDADPAADRPLPSFRPRSTLYHTRWPNPRPDQPIASVELTPSDAPWESLGESAVFAVNASHDDAAATPRFVSRFGDDADPGTHDRPWRTLRASIDRLEPGQTLYVREGRYHPAEQLRIAVAGTPQAWITVSGYFGEEAIIDGSGVFFRNYADPEPLEQNEGLIQLQQTRHVAVRGLIVERSRGVGIRSQDCHTIEIAFNTTYQTYNSGIFERNGDFPRIIGNTVVRPLSKQMFLDVRDETMPNRHPPDESITLARSRDFEVGWNEIGHSDKEGIDAKGPCRRGRIHHNYVHHTASVNLYVDAWTDHMYEIEVDHNRLYRGGGMSLASEGGAPLSDVRMHHNVIHECANGLSVASDWQGQIARIDNITLDHNTFVDVGRVWDRKGWFGSGVNLNGMGVRQVTITNNLMARTGHGTIVADFADAAARQVTLGGNLHFPFVEQPRRDADRRTVHRSDTAILEEPRFTDDGPSEFYPAPGSPGYATARGDDGRPKNVGALAGPHRGVPGIDPLTQRVRVEHRGDTRYEPVAIDPARFNTHVDRRIADHWFHRGSMWGHDLTAMPTGDRVLGEAEFHLPDGRRTGRPTAIALAGADSFIQAHEVRGLHVGRLADRLAFVHTFSPTRSLRERAGAAQLQAQGLPVVFRYVVHYADGSTIDVPVTYGRDIDAWYQPTAAGPVGRFGATPGYVQRIGDFGAGGWGAREDAWVATYVMTWANPTPDVPITSIDLANDPQQARNFGAPALLAISTGTRE